MTTRRLRVFRTGFPGRAAFDTAVSRALLHRVADGRAPESLRLHRASDALAFSVLDRTRPGFGAAVAAARDAGFEPIVRLAGGRAAVFHEETLAFSWTIPAEEPRRDIGRRFDETAALFRDALRTLGVDAHVGEVPREYCPGAHSVNARGARKIVGVGQRVVRGAAHVGGVVVVRASERVREALDPVYAALELDYDPETVGSVEDEVPGVTAEEVRDAVLSEFGERFALEACELPEELLTAAGELESEHRAGG